MSGKTKHKIVSGLFNVRANEVVQVRSLFLHHFFNGLGTATFFIAAITLFLNNHTIKDLPQVFILSGVIMFLVSIMFTTLEHKLEIHTFNKFILLLLIFISGISWVGITYWNPVVWSFLIFAGFRSLYMLSSLEFWGMSSAAFNIRQSKRLFGLISSGDIPAKVLGYLMVFLLIPRFELSTLFLIAVVSFLCSFLFMIESSDETENAGHGHVEESSYHVNTKNTAFRLIIFLSAISFVYAFSYGIIQFVFLSEVQDQAKSTDDLAFFFSVVYATSNLVIVIVKGFMTGRIIAFSGLKKVTQLTPLILSIIIVAGFVFTKGGISFYMLILLFFISEVLKYSLIYPSFLAMFQPLDLHNKQFAHVLTEGWVEPAALILAGFFLITLESAMGSQLILISMIMLSVCMVIWILIAQFRFGDYLKVVQQAITRRFVDGGSGFHPDKDSITVLTKNIKSDKYTTVIYCMTLLKESAPKLLEKEYPNLLNSSMPEVKLKAIGLLEDFDIPNAKNILVDLSMSDKPEYRHAALRALLAKDLLVNEDLNRYRQFNDSEMNYIIANKLFAIDSNSKNTMLLADLETWQNSTNLDDNIHFIKLVCKHKLEEYYNSLKRFLKSDDFELREICIMAICKSRDRALLELLQEYLEDKELLNIAKNYISLAGAFALPLIEKALENNQKGSRDKLHVWIRIASGIKEVDLTEFLLKQFGRLDVYTDKLILRRLNRSGWLLNSDQREIIARSFEDTVENLQFHLHNRHILPEKLSTSLTDFIPYLFEYLIYHSAHGRDASIYNRILNEFAKGSEAKRAAAMESLEADLPAVLFRKVNYLYEQFYEKRHHASKSPEHPEIMIHKIIEKNTRWFSKATVMYSLDYCLNNGLSDLAKPLEKHEDKDISDFAKSIINNDEINLPKMKTKESSPGFPFLEKMILLRNSGIFRDTPDHILAEIAAISNPVYLRESKVIFEMKDPGDCMFMIHSGKVNIESGEHVLAVLGEGDFFGEQSLLDDEPRSATARALTDALLLKIEQYDFYELMSDRSEVMQGVLKIISGRLRRQNHLIVQLKQEIEQLRVS